MPRTRCSRRPSTHARGEMDRHLLRPIRDVMWGANEALLDSTEFAQPALFAVEVALFRLLESWGVRPDYLHRPLRRRTGGRPRRRRAVAGGRGRAGGGQGQADAAPARGRRDGRDRGHRGRGAAAAAATASTSRPSTRPTPWSSPGPEDAGDGARGTMRAQGRRVHRLAVSHAFHSSLMEPMLVEFTTVASGMTVGAPTIPVVSNLTGERRGPDFGTAAVLGSPRPRGRALRRRRRVRSQPPASPASSKLGPGSGLTASVEQTLHRRPNPLRCRCCARTAPSRRPC